MSKIPSGVVVEVLIVSVTSDADSIELDPRVAPERNIRVRVVQLGGEGFTKLNLRGTVRSHCVLSGITKAELEKQYPEEYIMIKNSLITLNGQFLEI